MWNEPDQEVNLLQKESNEVVNENFLQVEIEIEIETEDLNTSEEIEAEKDPNKEIQIEKENESEKEKEKETWGYIYMDNGLGGLGDRFRASIVGYYIALLTNRALKINGQLMWGSEDDYFDTNIVNWKVSEEEKQVFGSPNTRRVEERIGHQNKERYHEMNFDSYKDFEIFVFHTNTIFLDLLAANPTLRSSPKIQFFDDIVAKGLARSHALKSLFKPGKKINQYLESFEKYYWPTNDTFRIGMHLRSGDNERLISNSRKRGRYVTFETVECFASKAISIWEEKKGSNEYKNVVFFVTADLNDFEEIVIRKIQSQGFKVFSHNNLGEAKHIHKSKADPFRTFVDWWTLTSMDVLLFSKSGFSESASHFSLAPSFVYNNNGGPCEHLFKPFDRTANLLFF